MKILLVSMPSIHASRWIDNLSSSGHELYWFNIANVGKLETHSNLIQITNWKKRKLPYIIGEHFLYKKFHFIYKKIQPYLETTIEEQTEKLIGQIQPDLVQSFEMHSCSYPLLNIMLKNPQIKWLYNCWGNDIFYFQNVKSFPNKIQKVMERINYFISDCERDIKLASKFGFKGLVLESLPTGGGYNLDFYNQYKLDISERKIILVKGYQHHFGRGLQIIKALQSMNHELSEFEVIVFGAHAVVAKYLDENQLKYQCFRGKLQNHEELLKIMGKSLIYIGNSISDGMPNTLLEAIIMGAFPIQSNPGGATSEIIEHRLNGLLIDNPESISEIAGHIRYALSNHYTLKAAYEINKQIAITKLCIEVNKAKILNIYDEIDKN